jgi:penicillin-binding protein 2
VRARAAHWVVTAALAVLVLRLFYLQVVEHERLFELARDNVLREEVLPAIRGVIRDREGRVLVDSEPSYAVALDVHDRSFRDKEKVERILERLSAIVQVDTETMTATINRLKGRSYQPVTLARHLDPPMVAYIEEHRDELPGVSIHVEPCRRHVYGSFAAHLLGYVGEITDQEVGQGGRPRAVAASDGVGPGRKSRAPFESRTYRSGDMIGRAGVEVAFETWLSGENGARMVEVTALGRRADLLVPRTRFSEVRRPVAGEDMTLTLDLDLQLTAEAAFPSGENGAAVVIDARNGEVLACLSRPDFDPNDFAKGLTGKAWDALNNHPSHPLLNRALRSAYPPGSVFKVVTGAAALTTNSVGPYELLRSCTGGYQFGARWFGCHKTHGYCGFSEAMMMSCDTYFYQAGLRVGLDELAQTARKFGLGSPTGIELGDKAGLIPDSAWYDRWLGAGRWTKGLILNMAIGQGEVLATPLQLAVMMAAAGTGQVVEPHVVKRIGRQEEAAPPTRPLDIPPAVRQRLVQALERVVNDDRGTGGGARLPKVRVAGKTGTAQNPHGKDHAVFAAFAPVANPEVAVAVVIETIGHGGEFAAPVAGKVLSAYFELKRTPLDVAASAGVKSTPPATAVSSTGKPTDATAQVVEPLSSGWR